MRTAWAQGPASRQTRRPLELAVWSLALGAVLALGGCSSDEPDLALQVPPTGAAATESGAASKPSSRAVMLRFSSAGQGEEIRSFQSSGFSPVQVELVTGGTGRVTGAVSPQGRAARFPSYAGGLLDFAILSVANEGTDDILGAGQDVLSPGEGAFVIGADVALDAVTTGHPSDDGDNLIQRGLFGGPSQYKIQVDDGYPSCLVRGLAGEVSVVAEVRIRSNDWYRVRCHRDQDTLRLQVARLGEDGPEEWSESTSSGPIGLVIMPSRTPLSVAGKLSDGGELVPASTDQLNGRLDRVYYDVVEGP